MDFTGKNILITGGSGGMGVAIAAAFHQAGANVVITGTREGKLAATAAKIAPDNNRLAYIAANVASSEDCRQVVEFAVSQGGKLDALINTAGVWVEGDSDTMTEDQWDHTIGVNLKGTFFMCRYSIPYLEAQEGSIINIASDAGLVGNAGAAIYCASKGGVVLLTKSMALELAPRGVRVNAVCPADVDTPMIQFQADEFGGGDPEGYLKNLLSNYPQKQRARFIRPEEIAATVLFLASPGAAPITGAAIAVDFGTTAGY